MMTLLLFRADKIATNLARAASPCQRAHAFLDTLRFDAVANTETRVQIAFHSAAVLMSVLDYAKRHPLNH